MLNVVEYTLVQIQYDLAVHRGDLVLNSTNLALDPVKRLGIAIEGFLMQGSGELPLFVVLLFEELGAQNGVLAIIISIFSQHCNLV